MKKGDFVLVDYVGRIAETGEIFDCTMEEEAKKGKAFVEGRAYAPAPVIIGAGMIIRGVENRMETMDVGSEQRFFVLPEEGFGPRVREMVRVISRTQFIRQRIDVAPGIYVRIDGMQAKVQSVSGGRVRVDFNDPLAGKRLDYTVRIIRKVDGVEEKLRLLMKHYNTTAETTYDAATKETVITTDKKLLNLLEKVVRGVVSNWMPEVAKLTFAVRGQPGDGAEEGKKAEAATKSPETPSLAAEGKETPRDISEAAETVSGPR